MLQSVSHDFRTPLATIAAAVDGLQDGDLTLTDDDRAALFETMTLEVARLIRLVENLLDLSRLQIGAAAPHPALWPVEELVPRAVAEVGGAGRVQMTFPDGLPPAIVDDGQIQRVLVNLIHNALKFSLGAVEVIPRAEAASLVIDIHDRGGAGAAGAGIGLSIAHGFAQVNGGSVELHERAEGGTTARLVLPAGRMPAKVPA